MTIHEIEERTGMTRANIRYYERAGLLAPERADNNYRDYSDADLAALQKVQLLRQLRVPVGEIARLRSGELELGGVLMEQSEKLRGESDELGALAAPDGNRETAPLAAADVGCPADRAPAVEAISCAGVRPDAAFHHHDHIADAGAALAVRLGMVDRLAVLRLAGNAGLGRHVD